MINIKKGTRLIGTRGKVKGINAVYLGRNSIRITEGILKGWVGTPTKGLFKLKKK